MNNYSSLTAKFKQFSKLLKRFFLLVGLPKANIARQIGCARDFPFCHFVKCHNLSVFQYCISIESLINKNLVFDSGLNKCKSAGQTGYLLFIEITQNIQIKQTII